MKKMLLTSLVTLFPALAGAASIPWWQQPTICKLDTTNCYSNMYGAGYETGMWDSGSSCWGLKLICPEALISTSERYPVPMEKADISKGKNINKDFDTNKLNNDCFGARKTNNDGTKVYVNGELVNVWCNGILMDVDENLSNGEITYGPQPTCEELAIDGYIGILNKRCYGKYYDPSNYFIECTSKELLPSRIIKLNGADYMAPSGSYPKDKSEATDLFNKMYENSKKQYDKYFEK